MVDHNGTLVDGDQLLYLIMQFYIKEGITFGGVVGTHMTNLAFEEKCKMQSIPFVRADVGDRYVSEELDRRKWILGGENSGHLLSEKFTLNWGWDYICITSLIIFSKK